MSGARPPLTCDQLKAILRKLGFEKRNQRGSHEQWVKTDRDGRFYKVTVDCPNAPFKNFLLKSMAKQAGVTVARIYEIHFDR